jgi:hypothetical protein
MGRGSKTIGSPKTEAERQRLAATIGADGFALLQAVYAPETPPEVRTEPAVDVLRRIWVQQYGPDDPPRWRHDVCAASASVDPLRTVKILNAPFPDAYGLP